MPLSSFTLNTISYEPCKNQHLILLTWVWQRHGQLVQLSHEAGEGRQLTVQGLEQPPGGLG